jgi:hypothetical protein
VAIQIISADQRLCEIRGATILLMGPVGVGKTWQLHSLPADRVLFIDAEAGDLCVQDVPVDTIRIDDWKLARDLACRIGGPNSSFPPTACYSLAHYEAVGGALPNHEKYTIVFLDSLTEISRLALRYAEQQPEAYSERTGKKDVRGMYGVLGREMIPFLKQFQYARGKSIVYVGILERVVDELKVAWQLQCEGNKTARELPGIVDQIVTYQFLDFGDGKPPKRGFVCTSPNSWNYPGKDRSGRLDQIEPPDLGKLLAKLTSKKAKEGLTT